MVLCDCNHMLSVKSQGNQYGSELNQIKHGGSQCIFNVSLTSFKHIHMHDINFKCSENI